MNKKFKILLLALAITSQILTEITIFAEDSLNEDSKTIIKSDTILQKTHENSNFNESDLNNDNKSYEFINKDNISNISAFENKKNDDFDSSKNIIKNKHEKNEISEVDKFIKGNDCIKNISGFDRIQTSIEISKFENVRSEKIILADAVKYPDALSASNITDGKYPVLLINKFLEKRIKKEIERLGASEAIIIGGINSIPKSVESSLKRIPSIKSIRRISGSNRFDTCKEIFESSRKEKIILASGDNFPDALASSFLLNDSGLLLIGKNTIPISITTTIENIPNKNLVIIGGNNSIGKIISNKLKSTYGIKQITRLAGNNRYSTSVEIGKKSNSEVVVIASGKNFPDALSASTLTQKVKAPTLLISRDDIDASVIDYIKLHKVKKAIILGGNNSISSVTRENIKKAIEGKNIIPKDKNVYSKENIKNNESEKNTLHKFMISTRDADIYSDSNLSIKFGHLPTNKVISYITESNNSVRINYNGILGWIEKNSLIKYDPTFFGVKINKVPYTSQLHPVSIPFGCEPVSLYMGLKGKNYTNISVKEFTDKMPKTSQNPKYGFVGSPYTVELGRFPTIDPEPLANYGKKYGNVVNIQGASIDDIIREIQNGNTVVTYITYFWEPATFRSLIINGTLVRRLWNNHVILLTGYDPYKKTFYVADPYDVTKAGAQKNKPFFYWKSYYDVNRCYSYGNRKFAVVIR